MEIEGSARAVAGFMNPRRLVLLLVLLVALPLSARPRPVAHPGPALDTPPRDVFSFAEPADVRMTHVSLDLTADFDARVLRGSVTLSIANLTGTRRLLLDASNLDIQSITIDGASATWRVDDGNSQGDALAIDILPSTKRVRIDYATRPSSAGLHWLTPLQTTGGVAPLLYTMSEPDLARSWVPLQDTPGVRVTWDAVIRVPHDLLAIASAEGNQTTVNPGGVYTFNMPTSVPAYLIAFAVGRFEFRPLGTRTGFYAEPEMADDAAWDLQYLPAMFDTAERVIGTYPWQRYDLLLLPPGFVAGGMENPTLNFLNVSSVVSGNHDTSPVLSSTVAHELAHTWVGDLTTCATWSDTWLNEGFATYFEKRILEAMAGDERSEAGFYLDREAYQSFLLLYPPASAVTSLHRSFTSNDAPNVFNATSYQKGGLFLRTLEDLLGRASFDEFMRFYLTQNVQRWTDDQRFLSALRMTALSGRPELEKNIRIDEWIYGTGLPSNVTAPTASRLWDRVSAEASKFRAGAPMSSLQTSGWSAMEIGGFLQLITDVLPERMAEVDAAFGMSFKKSASIDWWLAVATTRYAPATPSFERFMMSGSRNVITVYDRLSRTPAGLAYAKSLYAADRPRYVPEIQAYVDRILHWQAMTSLRTAA